MSTTNFALDQVGSIVTGDWQTKVTEYYDASMDTLDEALNSVTLGVLPFVSINLGLYTATSANHWIHVNTVNSGYPTGATVRLPAAASFGKEFIVSNNANTVTIRPYSTTKINTAAALSITPSNKRKVVVMTMNGYRAY